MGQIKNNFIDILNEEQHEDDSEILLAEEQARTDGNRAPYAFKENNKIYVF